jgi:hypothetical protein
VVAVKREDEQRVRAADLGVRVLGVVHECGLRVRSRRDEPVGMITVVREGVGEEVPDRWREAEFRFA